MPSSFVLRTALLLALIGIAACGTRPAAPPRLRISGTESGQAQGKWLVDFGVVESGTQTVRTVVLSNDGDAPLRIVGLTTEDGAPAQDAEPPFHLELATPVELSPGASFTLSIEFAPTTKGGQWQSTRFFVVEPQDDSVAQARIILRGATSPRPCAFDFEPQELAFGAVNAEGAVKTITLRNMGGPGAGDCAIRDLRVVDVPFANAPGGFVLTDASDRILHPGAEAIVAVRAQPTGDVAAWAELQFTVDDVTPRTVQVPLHAVFNPQGCVVISPAQLDFVSDQCLPPQQTVSLYNTCSDPIVVRKFRISEPGGLPAGAPGCEGTQPCPAFLITSGPAMPPDGLELFAGQPLSFGIRYLPLQADGEVGTFEIAFDYRGVPATTTVSLTGHGRALVEQKDVYSVGSTGKGDYLFVIDDGPQMAAYEPALSNSLTGLAYVLGPGCGCFDANVGVITSDTQNAATAGVLLSDGQNPAVLNALATPKFGQVLSQRLHVSSTPGATATPLAAAADALSPALLSGANAGLLRGAPLHLIIYTSRSDASPLPVSDYLQLFANAQPAPSSISILVVGGFGDLSCGLPADDGRLAQAASDPQSAISLCDPPSLGCAAFACRSQFFLSAVPDKTKPIELSLNGAPLPSTDPTSGATNWTFDPVSNAVDYPAAAYQPPLSTLEIRYSTPCYP